MILSVLIPTLVERRSQFYNLIKRLKFLARDYPVEILSIEDNREKTTGAKRNELIDMAKGRFSVFIDDDDNVPAYYFDSIFNAIKQNPDTDCIGFKGLGISAVNPNNHSIVFRYSVGLPYSRTPINREYTRPPTHINPMLTDYFKQVRFPDKTISEDFEFCLKLAEMGLVKNQTFLDIVMYHYYYSKK